MAGTEVAEFAAVRVVALTPYSTIVPTTALIGPNCLDVTVARNPGQAAFIVNPYKDAEAVSQAATYCWGTSLTLCRRLGEGLGGVVGESHSQQYWESLLLPWTTAWVENVYDRYLRLCWVRERCPNAWLELPKLIDVPQFQSSGDVTALAHTHPINIRYYGELIRGMGLDRRVRSIAPPPPVAITGAGPSYHIWLQRAKFRLSGLLGISRYREANLRWFEATDLTVADNGFGAVPVDRRELAIEPLSGEFGALVAAMAPGALPVSLVEEYQSRRRYAAGLIVRERMRVLFVPHTVHQNDSIKYLIAEFREQAKPVVVRQHGHAYGTLDVFSAEWVERRLADHFLTWGWTDGHGDAVALPDPWLTPPRASERKPGHHVLYVMTEGSMYMYRYVHEVLPDSFLATYLPWQEAFFRALPDATRRRVLVRPYPQQFGWGMRQRLDQIAAGIRIEAPRRSRASLLGSRLVVVDHPGTSMLEALAWNVPVVAFWDPQGIPLKPWVRPRYDALRSVGILHDTPAAAARHVADVADDPSAWWNSPGLQAVRAEFCREFARGATDWPEQWRDALGPLVGLRKTSWWRSGLGT